VKKHPPIKAQCLLYYFHSDNPRKAESTRAAGSSASRPKVFVKSTLKNIRWLLQILFLE